MSGIDQKPTHRALAVLAAGVVLLVSSAHPCAGADLDSGQKQLLAQVEATLKHIEANVRLAQDAAGPGDGPVKGAKAKLAATRLAEPRAKMPAVLEALKKLPAEDAGVKAAQARADAAAAAIDKLIVRIEGKTSTPPPADTVKLDYKQVEHLKNARFYLREIEGHRQAVAKVVDNVKPVQDVHTISHQVVGQAMDSIAKAHQRAKLVTEALANVPPNGEGVHPVAEGFKEAMAGLDASRKVLEPIHKKLSALVDPANYPDLDADVKRLQELAGMFANVQVFDANPQQAAAVAGQLKPAWQEAIRVYKKYEPLVRQATPQGQRVHKMSQHFVRQHKAFTAKVAEKTSVLPAAIRADLKQVHSLAEEAVKEQRPLYFTGGVRDMLRAAQERLDLLEALSPEAAAPLAKEVAQIRADVKSKQASLSEAIIRGNTMPPDRYTGDDKPALTELTIEAWKKIQPDAQVLAVRFASSDWTRERTWYYSSRTWSLSDQSRLQAQLLVKFDGKLAVNRPVNLWKNHLKNDAIHVVPMFDKVDNDLTPEWFYLLANVKTADK